MSIHHRRPVMFLCQVQTADTNANLMLIFICTVLSQRNPRDARAADELSKRDHFLQILQNEIDLQDLQDLQDLKEK